MSHDPDHAHFPWGQLVIRRLILHVVNSCTKFEVSSCSRCRDIVKGVQICNVPRVPDHTPFRDGLLSAGWDLLPLTYRPNMKFLTTPIMKIRVSVQNVQNWDSLVRLEVTQCHRQCHHSIERMRLFYSTLI